MELYGRNQGTGGSGSGQIVQWGPAATEAGLVDSMLRLGLRNNEPYPERPGVVDCNYYMRTGLCAFGSRCRYNHPCDRSAVTAALRYEGGYPERPGELACQYYLKTGSCKFGMSCKFDHPKHAGSNHQQLNFQGYPLRPGEKECSYYMKMGQCKFGKMCKFHHPHPAGTSMTAASAPTFYPTVQSPPVPLGQQYGGASTSWRVARPPLLPSSYVPGAYGPMLLAPGMVSISNWGATYSASVSPALSPGAQPTVGGAALYGITQLTSSPPTLSGPYSPLSSSPGLLIGSPKEWKFPERPGQPVCQYYLKTSDCKFGTSCRFHHPPEFFVSKTDCSFSPLGLPLRPGVQPCTFYEQNGHCKFGAMCKFDHPMKIAGYTPAASSFMDIPVTPYPVGFTLGSLAGSSSALQSEFISRSKKDTNSSTMSSKNSSISSAGLVFSPTGSGSISAVQLSGQASGSFSSRSGRGSGEIHR